MASLILSLINNVGFDFEMTMETQIINAFLTVLLATVGGFFGSIYLAQKFVTTSMMSSMVLSSVQKKEDGFVGVNVKEHEMIGKQGIAFTILRPSGKIEIDGDVYDATALTGYIDKGEAISVVKYETAQLFVRKV